MSAGCDLNRYLSANIKNLVDRDTLLKGWNVHHLHLSTRMATKGKNKGFVKRDDLVLLCYFTDTDAYLLEVIDHDSFESAKPLDIMKQNWPSLLAQHRVPGVTLYPDDITPEQLFKLTECGYMTPLMDQAKNVYMPLGGGATGPLHSGDDLIMASKFLSFLRFMQDAIVDHVHKNSSDQRTYPIRLSLGADLDLRKWFVSDIDNGDRYDVPRAGGSSHGKRISMVRRRSPAGVRPRQEGSRFD